MQFRKIKQTDLDCIYEIEKSVFSHPWSKEQIMYELDNVSFSSNWLGIINDEIVGYIMSHTVGSEAQIINIAVKLEHQCRGIGKNILKEFLNQFTSNTYFFLEVRESNIPAFNMYFHLGFEQIDTRKKYYANGEDAIVMEKQGNSIPKLLESNSILI